MAVAILCSEGTSWLSNEYSRRIKNSILSSLDERYAAVLPCVESVYNTQ